MVKQQAEKGMTDEGVAVQVCGLIKTYPSTYTLGCSCVCCCCCLKVKRTAPYHAVKGLWLNLAKGQLFCLLGPNGAGKTTTISCLTGITPITGGDALVYGHSVASSVGMAKIRRLIGVCPQFDILWDALTGQEHLELFANIKGLPPSEIKSVAAKSLSEGKLKTATNVRVGNYSGGMKRHLSVAIALIGDPRLVFLDEPTTGMDPITRRHVWDIIEDAKKGRAIVLTTHSMEEADILGDRIAIMAKGKLRCIGTSIHLKSRFGAGYVCNINFSTTNGEPQTEPVKFFFYNHLDLKPTEESKTFLTFIIPHNKETLLARFFAELQEREYEFGISDIQMGLTTLEEVFLNIAKQAELESSSAAQENLVVLHLTSGTSIQVSMGVRFVGIPGTESAEHPKGLMVEVFWKTDDAGTLCISHHSPEAPIPPNVELIKNESLIGDMPVGFTIDPNQILNANER
ncbi:ABC transporter A family member 2 [Rhynchospora pubera]|uniref:ABC transporter A family member 2 n=1 Tax=Rhynchospora pubera TaxID=906938 RepID=A0AAV8END7_9POAL|nr:ABC transporter A family member 2 [Rhynchospora pubera]